MAELPSTYETLSVLEELDSSADAATSLTLTSGRVGLAFGLVIAAGFSTCLGASIAFFVKVTNKRILAGALSLSAGVMIFISLVEIVAVKSVEGFVDAGHTQQHALAYAYLTFFSGLLLTWALDQIVHLVMHMHDRRREQQHAALPAGGGVQDMNAGALAALCAPMVLVLMDDDGDACKGLAAHAPRRAGREGKGAGAGCAGDASSEGSDPSELEVAYTLRRMSLLAALAIAIHNMPEGLAAFIGTVADPKMGVAIAFAIAMHNIPEGIVVCIPLYYATGSRLKGLAWAALSGAAEVLGAIIGYLVVQYSGTDPPLLYALVFGVVGGMMTYISLFELLPTALRYDPSQRLVMGFTVLGMAIMAASIVLFEF